MRFQPFFLLDDPNIFQGHQTILGIIGTLASTVVWRWIKRVLEKQDRETDDQAKMRAELRDAGREQLVRITDLEARNAELLNKNLEMKEQLGLCHVLNAGLQRDIQRFLEKLPEKNPNPNPNPNPNTTPESERSRGNGQIHES